MAPELLPAAGGYSIVVEGDVRHFLMRVVACALANPNSVRSLIAGDFDCPAKDPAFGARTFLGGFADL